MPRQMGNVGRSLLSFGNIFMNRDPPTVLRTLVRNRYQTTVGESLGKLNIITGSNGVDRGKGLPRRLGERPPVHKKLRNCLELSARLAQLGRKAVELRIPLVTDDQPLM